MRFGGSCQVGNPGIQMIVHALKCGPLMDSKEIILRIPNGLRLFDRALICG